MSGPPTYAIPPSFLGIRRRDRDAPICIAGIPLDIGVILTAADVFLILALQAFGFRWVEAFVVAMLGVI